MHFSCAGRQRGLEQVRRVERAARRRAGADDRVDLVDEQDRLADCRRAASAPPSGAARNRRDIWCPRAARPCRANRPGSRCRSPGTSPSTMRRASPSAIAVLPTPASPTSSGLFLRRRHSIWTTRSSSCSRPISGSILPDERQRVEVERVVLERAAGLTLPCSVSASLSVFACCACGILRDAVRDVS